jgi:hypothetical protein
MLFRLFFPFFLRGDVKLVDGPTNHPTTSSLYYIKCLEVVRWLVHRSTNPSIGWGEKTKTNRLPSSHVESMMRLAFLPHLPATTTSVQPSPSGIHDSYAHACAADPTATSLALRPGCAPSPTILVRPTPARPRCWPRPWRSLRAQGPCPSTS